jgi:hypothetical protein
MVIQPKLVTILIVSLMLTRCAMVHGRQEGLTAKNAKVAK